MLKRFYQAGVNGLPMPEQSKKGTGTTAAIIGGACGATGLVAFVAGWAIRAYRVPAPATK